MVCKSIKKNHDYLQAFHGPLAIYVNFRAAHVPGMPGTFSPPHRVSDPDMHHGTCVMHVPWCVPGSPTSSFRWSRRRGKRSRHSQCMHNPRFYVSGKRPIVLGLVTLATITWSTKVAPFHFVMSLKLIWKLGISKSHTSAPDLEVSCCDLANLVVGVPGSVFYIPKAT